jgi:hypothetical protein
VSVRSRTLFKVCVVVEQGNKSDRSSQVVDLIMYCFVLCIWNMVEQSRYFRNILTMYTVVL